MKNSMDVEHLSKARFAEIIVVGHLHHRTFFKSHKKEIAVVQNAVPILCQQTFHCPLHHHNAQCTLTHTQPCLTVELN